MYTLLADTPRHRHVVGSFLMAQSWQAVRPATNKRSTVLTISVIRHTHMMGIRRQQRHLAAVLPVHKDESTSWPHSLPKQPPPIVSHAPGLAHPCLLL